MLYMLAISPTKPMQRAHCMAPPPGCLVKGGRILLSTFSRYATSKLAGFFSRLGESYEPGESIAAVHIVFKKSLVQFCRG